jgi:hypothetical protein
MYTSAQGSVEVPVHQRQAERRRYRRYSIIRPATILTKTASIPCSTIDISATGMRLHLPRRGPMPDRFILCLGDHERLLGQLVTRQGSLARIRLLSERAMIAWVLRDVVPMAEFLERFPRQADSFLSIGKPTFST